MTHYQPLRAAVVGVGSLGRHHARIYSQLAQTKLVAVCDTDEARAREYASTYGCEAITDFRELAGRIDVASVATPTVTHADIGCYLLDAGISTLVEKPIAASLADADRLIAAASLSGATLMVGHSERFNPATIAATPIITTPRFIEVHRLAEFTPRSLDIDVVMDLMIHDIDVILSFVKAEVVEINAAGIGILTPRVDIANARIEFANGCIANVTASRVSSERVRKIRLFQPSDYVSVDFAAKEVSVVSLLPPQPGDDRPRIATRTLEIVDVEPLTAEISAFVDSVTNRSQPIVSGDDGRRALDVAVQVLDSIRSHARKIGVDLGS